MAGYELALRGAGRASYKAGAGRARVGPLHTIRVWKSSSERLALVKAVNLTNSFLVKLNPV